MGETLAVLGDLYIGSGSSLTANVLRVTRLGTDLVPRVVVDGGSLYVHGQGDQLNRFYNNYISLGQNHSTNAYRGEMIIHSGDVSLPALGMARYSLEYSTHARLVVNGGTLTIRGEADGLVGGASETSVVEIDINDGFVDIQNKRGMSLSGNTSRINQRGGFVRTGFLWIGGRGLYEMSGGELLVYAGEGSLTSTSSVFRIVGPDPVVTMNTFTYDAVGAVQYVMTRAPGHIAPIKMNWEVRRLNTLPVAIKGGVLLAATNRFVLMNYTYGSRDDAFPANTDVWNTDWAAKNDTELAITFTSPLATLTTSGVQSVSFPDRSGGVVAIDAVNPSTHPDGLAIMVDIEPRNGSTLETLLDGIHEAGYTNSTLTGAGAYSMAVKIPPEDLAGDQSYFAWDFFTLFTNAPAAVVRSVRIGDDADPSSLYVIE